MLTLIGPRYVCLCEIHGISYLQWEVNNLAEHEELTSAECRFEARTQTSKASCCLSGRRLGINPPGSEYAYSLTAPCCNLSTCLFVCVSAELAADISNSTNEIPRQVGVTPGADRTTESSRGTGETLCSKLVVCVCGLIIHLITTPATTPTVTISDTHQRLSYRSATKTGDTKSWVTKENKVTRGFCTTTTTTRTSTV